jgi:hypothetical protein
MRSSYTCLLVLSLLLMAALMGAASVWAGSVTVRVGSVEAAPEAVAEVPVTLEGSPGIGAMHLELTYDPALLAVESVEQGSLVASNALAAFNTEEAGRIVISLAAADEIAGDGTLAVARFLVRGDTGQTTALDLEYPQAWDGEGFEVAVELEPGQLTVGSSGLPLFLLAALGLLALVLILLAVVLLARRGRRRKPVAPVSVHPTPQEQATLPKRQLPPGQQPPTPAPKFCGHCGQPLEPGMRFCVQCGQPVGG